MPNAAEVLKVLVATDGSEHAAGALRMAAALARRGARLRVLLLNVQKPLMSGEVGVIAPASVAREAREQSAAEILEAAARLLADAAVPCERREVFDEPGGAIAACAARENCDAIAVGSRGVGAVRSVLLGSVSSEVIRRADRPLIVVPSPEGGIPEGPLRILAAVDGSEPAVRALAFAVRLARASLAAELQLVHVLPPLSVAGAVLGPRERLLEHWSARAAHETFAAVEGLLEGSGGVAHSAHILQDPSPADAIVRHASAAGCGMIAMGTRGLNPIAGLLLGSVAQGVLGRVRMPVVLAR